MQPAVRKEEKSHLGFRFLVCFLLAFPPVISSLDQDIICQICAFFWKGEEENEGNDNGDAVDD